METAKKKITYNELVEWQKTPEKIKTFTQSNLLHIVIDLTRAKENVEDFYSFKKIYDKELTKNVSYNIDYKKFLKISKNLVMKFLHLAEYYAFCPQKGEYSKELSLIIDSQIPFEPKIKPKNIHLVLSLIDFFVYIYLSYFALIFGLRFVITISVFGFFEYLINKSASKHMHKRGQVTTILKIHVIYMAIFVCVLALLSWVYLFYSINLR